jgi:hypothetical protein
LRSSHSEGGNGSRTPCLKGRVSFIGRQRPDDYRLVTFIFGSKLHGQWGPRLRRSVRSGWIELPWHSSGLPGVHLGSRAVLALRWMISRMVLGDVASWRGFTCLLNLTTWGSMWMG